MTPSMPVFYLFASPAGEPVQIHGGVFYKVEGESLANALCRLFTREYADGSEGPAFHHKAATSIPIEEQVLFDESLDWLAVYDDPDPGVYDPSPPPDMLLLAQYAVRAQKWEELLRRRTEPRATNDAADDVTSASRDLPDVDEQPEMSAEDRRNSGLILLMLLAQAYYKILESVISMVGWVTAVDLELNQCYFWVVTTITNLLNNHEDLKDFPGAFEPPFRDLYPSTIRDTDWEDGIAPDVEQFLSTVQQYIFSKGVCEPGEGSPGWVFIELFRPGVNTAIERACAYNKRTREYCQRALGSSTQRPGGISSGASPQSELSSNLRDKNHSNGARPTMPTTQRNKVFVSYSHSARDRKLFEEFKTMMAPAIQKGIVDLWDDTKIQPGQHWKMEIEKALAAAKVGVLLVSKNFLASEFISKNELPPLLNAAKVDGATIFWVCLSPCLHEQTEIGSYQAAHDISKPLSKLSRVQRDAAWQDICEKLLHLVGNPK